MLATQVQSPLILKTVMLLLMNPRSLLLQKKQQLILPLTTRKILWALPRNFLRKFLQRPRLSALMLIHHLQVSLCCHHLKLPGLAHQKLPELCYYQKAHLLVSSIRTLLRLLVRYFRIQSYIPRLHLHWKLTSLAFSRKER